MVPLVPPQSPHSPWNSRRRVSGASHRGARGLEEKSQPRCPRRHTLAAEEGEDVTLTGIVRHPKQTQLPL